MSSNMINSADNHYTGQLLLKLPTWYSEEISNQPAAGVFFEYYLTKSVILYKNQPPGGFNFLKIKKLNSSLCCQTFLELKTRGKWWDFGCWGSFNNNWPIVQLTMSYGMYRMCLIRVAESVTRKKLNALKESKLACLSEYFCVSVSSSTRWRCADAARWRFKSFPRVRYPSFWQRSLVQITNSLIVTITASQIDYLAERQHWMLWSMVYFFASDRQHTLDLLLFPFILRCFQVALREIRRAPVAYQTLEVVLWSDTRGLLAEDSADFW